jgi:NAD(P)H-flavin reductase
VYAIFGAHAIFSLIFFFLLFFRLPRLEWVEATVTKYRSILLVELSLHRPLRVASGQHIDLWMPSMGFPAFLQLHPFMVASWSDQPRSSIKLLIQPLSGVTRELFEKTSAAAAGEESVVKLPVLFSGPHGRSVPVGEYEVVVMTATGFGIVALLPYIQQLIHEYNVRKVRTRRLHIVWIITALDIGSSHGLAGPVSRF